MTTTMTATETATTEANKTRALAVGSFVVIETADRKRSQTCTVVDRFEGEALRMIGLQSASTYLELVLRADDTVDHVVRWGIRRGATPTITTLRAMVVMEEKSTETH